MSSRRFTAVVGVLAVIALCSGCVALDSPSSSDADGDSEPDLDALFEATFVYSDDLEDVQGELTSEATDGNATLTEVEQVYERPYLDRRTETLEATDPDEVGSIYVANESISWWYYPDDELATYFENDEPHSNEETRADRAEMAADQRDLYDLEYAGTEEIADRKTHVLDIEAREEAVEQGLSILVGDTEYVYALETVDPEAELEVIEQTVWIDAEYDYPLKERLLLEGPNGEQHEMTERYETVSFNSGLEDDTFNFAPSKNVEVHELE